MREPQITVEMCILYPVLYATDNGFTNAEVLEKEPIAL